MNRAGERVDELIVRRSNAAVRQARQPIRVGLAINHRLHDGASRDAQHIADDFRQLEIRVFESSAAVAWVPPDLSHQLGARPDAWENNP